MTVAVALTIAGSDPSGGAGLQADLKTFHQLGVYGEAVVTLVTVQNTCGVYRVECLKGELVKAQIDAVIADIVPGAAKTGALGSVEVVEAVAEAASSFSFPLVVDPVMISKHGAPLLEETARVAVKRKLLPLAFVVTPNLPEAGWLANMEVRGPADMREAARRIADMGPKAVLVKGGHLTDRALDVLLFDGRYYEYAGEKVRTRHTHGTGCTLSAAITAELAKGKSLVEAVERAKIFVSEAIRTSPGLGRGSGPLNHHAMAGRPGEKS